MIRAKMSSAEAKKAKRRKTRKPSKGVGHAHPLNTVSFESLPTPKNTSAMNLSEDLRQVLEQVEEIPMPPNGVIQNLNLGPLPAVPNFSMTLPTSPAVPYMGRDTCLLCHRERPDPPGHSKSADLRNDTEDNRNQATPLPLWVCPDCRKTVEEEERRGNMESSRVDDVRLESVPTLPIFPAVDSVGSPTATQCNCEACIERRQIEAEHVKETQELQQCWMELRHVVRCVYREAGTGYADNKQLEERREQLQQNPSSNDEQNSASLLSTLPDVNKMKELVHRLCSRDAHQLYQRLESQGREYVIEMKVRMLKQLTCGHKTPTDAKQFVSMLLDEYANLCYAAETLATFLTELETEHLKKFNLSWQLHNKHLYQSIIYSDPVVQNSLPELMSQLQQGREPSAGEEYDEETYTSLLQRYLHFDSDMTVISVTWRDCQQLLDNYNDEQAALKAKQKMLKEDWEFFKAQRKLLEQQVLKNKDVPLSPGSHLSFEAHFTETMRHILSGTKPTSDEYTCPSCNRKRCPCDECTISHMITCGIISPDVTEQLPTHHHHSSGGGGVGGIFPNDPSRYGIHVTPPSMSSTSSSSGASSPIPLDPETLVLPFEDCAENFDEEDEIPEEIGISEDESTSDKNEAMAAQDLDDDDDSDSGSVVDREGGREKQAARREEGEERTEADGVEDPEEYDEDDDLDEDDDDGTDGDFGDDEEEDDDDDDIEESDDDEEFASGEDEEQSLDQLELDEHDEAVNAAMAAALRQASMLPELAGPSDACDCTHCAQAKQQQQQAFDDESSLSQQQCQCHACVQQTAGISSLPHPTTPTSSSPRPAALHLYPHIHGANNVAGLHAARAAGHHGPLLQPHLYELHNPLHAKAAAAAATNNNSSNAVNSAAATTAAAPFGTPQHSKTTSASSTRSSLNLDIDSHEALHEHIYHAYGDWDNSYDATKIMLAGHKFSGALATELLGSAPPLMTGNPFMQDGASLGAGETLDMSSLSSHVASGAIQFGAAVSSSAACSSHLSSDSSAASSSNTSSASSSTCSIAAAFADNAGPSTCAGSALFHSSVINHHSAKSDHVHTDACFKNMKTLPASSTGSRMLFNSNQSVSEALKAGSLLAPAASSGGSHSSQSAGASAFSSNTTSIASLATGVNLPLSEHCLKHNPFLHTHHSSFSGTHTTTTISTSSGLPAHPPPMKLTSELIRSVAMKEGANTPQSLVTSQPVSTQPVPSASSNPHTCAHMHGGAGANMQGGISQHAGQHNLHTSLLDPNSQAHNQSLSAAMANAFNSGAGGGNNTYNNVSVGTSTGCEAGCDGHHDDQYDSVDDSCSEQSSSTSASNQKDGKYCDCCYCEFFGHSNPPQAPTSRNYAEMRDRLRLRLKKKNEQKTEKYERIAPKPSLRKEDMVDRRGLDELIKFINGAEESMGMGGAIRIEDKASGKAAKRQRQKQRKFEEKLRKDREEMERKAREEAEQRRAAEVAAQLQKLHLQQQQHEAERAAAKGKNKKKGKHKDISPTPQGERVHAPNTAAVKTANTTVVKNKNEATMNNNTSNKETETSNVTNGRKNVRNSQPSVNESKPNPKVSTANVRSAPKAHQSSSQVNNTSNAAANKAATEAAKKVAPRSQQQQVNPVKQNLPANNKTSASRVPAEIRRKPDGASSKPEMPRPEASKAAKKPRQALQQPQAHHQQQPNANERVPTAAKSQNSTSKMAMNNQPSVAQTSHQKGDARGTPTPQPQQAVNGNGSKLGLNMALQATARALERKRDLLQKQKQQAEQNEAQQQAAAAATAATQDQSKNKATATRAKKPTSNADQLPNHAPSTPTKQQRQQMLNNMMMNMQQHVGQGKSGGMRLPVQKPAAPPTAHQHQQQHVTEASHTQVNGKPRQQQQQQQQVNGSVPTQQQQQQQQQQPMHQMMNGIATPRTPEKRMDAHTAQSNHAQKQGAATPVKEATRQAPETGGSASKMRKNRKKGKGVDDVEEIFKPKEDVDSDTGDMDDFERELEEFKRFCWDSAPPPQKEKVKVNVNLKDIFNKKGKQGVSCS